MLIPEWIQTEDIITPSLIGETHQNAMSIVMKVGIALDNQIEHKTSPIEHKTQKAVYAKGIVMTQSPLS
ncbi:MAG: hypothetical protein NZ961_13045, partial [Candidatus Poribacteria bacterium]|nr:hypothetical protein [Candidatus Poribacteria bacterium]